MNNIPEMVFAIEETRHRSFRYCSKALKSLTQAFQPAFKPVERRFAALCGDDGLEPWPPACEAGDLTTRSSRRLQSSDLSRMLARWQYSGCDRAGQKFVALPDDTSYELPTTSGLSHYLPWARNLISVFLGFLEQKCSCSMHSESAMKL